MANQIKRVMNELSIEQKSKRYDEAIKAAKSLCKITTSLPMKEYMESIFPELKESEDERIRKAISQCVEDMRGQFEKLYGVHHKDAIAWLEKQYKKDEEIILLKDKIESLESARIAMQECHRLELEKLEKQGEPSIYDVPSRNIILAVWELGNNWKELTNGCISTEHGTQLEYIQKHWNESEYYLREKQDEHKPAIEMKSAEESLGIDSETYNKIVDECVYGEQKPTVWTIKDAKAGDVLNSVRVNATIIFKGFAEDGKHILAYCALQKGIFIKQEMLWDRDFEPASEYWKNALYDAMVKAGYEWDAEKKELRKIEQKPAWSEDDEVKINRIVACLENLNVADNDILLKDVEWLKSLKDRIQPKQEWTAEDERIVTELIGIFESAVDGGHVTFPYRLLKDYIRVLKLCLPQSTWKPSDEQITALQTVYDWHKSRFPQLAGIESLINELKKLK